MDYSKDNTWIDPIIPFDSFGPLLTPADAIEQTRGSGIEHYNPCELATIVAMAHYSRDFLTAKHPDLGRPGPVCPFTAGALYRNLLRITASRLERAEDAALTEALAALRNAFLGMSQACPARYRLYKSIVVTFPWIPEEEAPALIQRVQKALKPDYVGAGLMIGEFFPDCQAPGLHNAAFRPLQSPVTSIAIRHMVLQDAPFMLADAQCRVSYENYFGDDGRRHIQNLLDARTACPVALASDTNRTKVSVNNA